MATITLTDNGANIILSVDGAKTDIPKANLEVQVRLTTILLSSPTGVFTIPFAQVTSPSTANVEALRVAIDGYIQAGASLVTAKIEDTAGNALTSTGGSLNVNVTGGGSGGGAVTVADGANVVEGATTDAAVTTNTTGTISGKLRGLIALIVAKINIKVADGDDLAQGSTSDAAATDSTSAWSVVALLKGLIAKYISPANFVTGTTTDITGTSATDVLAAAGVSTYNHITTVLVTNSHATVGTFVNIIEETSGTILISGYAAPAGGGFSMSLPIPIRQGTANKKIQAQCVTTSSNTRVTIAGYKAS